MTSLRYLSNNRKNWRKRYIKCISCDRQFNTEAPDILVCEICQPSLFEELLKDKQNAK